MPELPPEILALFEDIKAALPEMMTEEYEKMVAAGDFERAQSIEHAKIKLLTS